MQKPEKCSPETAQGGGPVVKTPPCNAENQDPTCVRATILERHTCWAGLWRRVLELQGEALQDAVETPRANTKTRRGQEKRKKRIVQPQQCGLGKQAETPRPPTQVEDGNLRLSPRFLVHHCYLTTSQSKESHPPWGLTPNFVCKTIPLTIEDFRILGTWHSSPVYWHIYSKCRFFLPYRPMSVAWSEQTHLVQ